jgi:hypothetical protein
MRYNRLPAHRRFMKGVPVVVLAVACTGISGPQTSPFGFLQVVTRAQAGQPVSAPTATFVNTTESGYPDSRDTTNVCASSDVTGGAVSGLQSLDAGDSIAFTSERGTVYLYPVSDIAGSTSYRPGTSSVGLTPGTEVTFQIPGASGGFPAATLSALTAPALTELSAIPASVAASDSMVVTWVPPGDDSSRIEVVLQYGAAGVPVVNRQVLCQWRDDGRQAIAGTLLAEWSRASLRQVQVTRFRTMRQAAGSGAVLYFLATYDTIPASPP